MKTLFILFCLMLFGCSKPIEDTDATVKLRGDTRQTLFKECMELAVKMPRHSDDDVADIVSACGNQSYYLTNYLVSGEKT